MADMERLQAQAAAAAAEVARLQGLLAGAQTAAQAEAGNQRIAGLEGKARAARRSASRVQDYVHEARSCTSRNRSVACA